MLRNTQVRHRHIRHFNNLASKFQGRSVTAFMFPYRHWAWKQGEVLRHVHEAQFEHLRRVYKRQWLESFRVNADEYIHKYNITKAAQIAEWEHEMHQQEAKRKETMMMAQGREQLRKKHIDLLREYHERQFFHWYERASERLQYMTRIPYVNQAALADHIEAELNKYVAGQSKQYPLNFVGQMPMLEDSDGNVVEVPEAMMTQHVSERQTSTAKPFAPPKSQSADTALRQTVVSAAARDLFEREESVYDAATVATTVNDATDIESDLEANKKSAKSMEDTEEDRRIARQNYVARGKIGSKAPFRRAKADLDSPLTAAPSAPSTGSTQKLRPIKGGAEGALLAKLRARTEGGKVSIRDAAFNMAVSSPEAQNPTVLQSHSTQKSAAKASQALMKTRKEETKKKKGNQQNDSQSKDF